MNKRFLIAIAIILVALLGVFLAVRSRRPAPGTITLKVIGEDYSPMQGLEKIKGDFTRETGIEVEISKFDAETVRKKSIGDFQAGAANYDVIMGAFYDVGLFGSNGWVLNLDQSLNKPGWKDPAVDLNNFSPQIVNLCCRYRDTLYALPASAQSMYLWYRKDLFDSTAEKDAFKKRYGYDLPSPTPQRSMTWAQYKDVAEFFTRPKGASAAGKPLDQPLFGTVLQAKNHIALWFEFNNFLHSFGGRFVSSDGKTVEIDSPAARTALDYYIGLKKFSPPGTLNYSWDEALSAFQNGQIAMAIMWSDSISAVEDPKSSHVVGQVGFAANPTLTEGGEAGSVFGGWGLFVNVRSHYPEDAVKLIQWVNRPDVQLKWAKEGGIPATLSTYSSPQYTSIPGAQAHLESLKHLIGWSTEPYSSRMIEVGQNNLAKAVAGDVTPERALKDLAVRIREITASQ
jgi:multiple sugar transport system substrate-binding protein